MRHDSPHYRLIARALLGEAESPVGEWDWDETVRIAAREEVLPTLHGKLRCPPEISSFLDGIHQLNAERNRQLLSEVEQIGCLLNGVGIQPVLLKGAAYLVSGLYPEPADRMLHDIDLLVDPARSREAFEVVRNSGYEPYVPNPTALILYHHPTLTQLRKVPVEVHHSIGKGAGGKILTAGEIIAESTPVSLGQATLKLPTPENLMTHLVVHSQMQSGPYSRVWPSLRMMYDVFLLDRNGQVDWGKVRSSFQVHGKAPLLDVHLLQIEQVLGLKPAFGVRPENLRWRYRRALWREPRLRYIDPLYTFSRIVAPKLRLGWDLLKEPVGRKYILTTPFRSAFYKRLLDDILQG